METPLNRAHKKFLTSLFGEKEVIFDPPSIAIYGTDASKEFSWPWAVVRPECEEQVIELLKWADQEKIPIIPRARASNVVGACVPVSGGVVVSTLKLNKILEINDVDFVAVVEPGVITGDLQKELKKYSLFYPPDPASADISTIGGNVSQNAGGLRAVKYGVTKDYVLGMDVILPGGKKIVVGSRCHKDVVGLDLKSIMIGSEGTLGFFTKIILKLIPKPETSISLLLGFSSLDKLLQGAISILKNGLLPVAMEFMDNNVMQCIREIKDLNIPEKAKALLILKFDGNQGDVDFSVKRCEEVFKDLDIVHYEKGEGSKEDEIWDIRRMINPASHKLGKNKIALDICVPRSKIPAIVNYSIKKGEEKDIFVLCFGHLGDGNIHVNLMYTDEKQNSLAHLVAAEILNKTIELGGTISGEHGVGILKKDFLTKQLDNKAIYIMKRIKKIFDPNNIMNPYKAY